MFEKSLLVIFIASLITYTTSFPSTDSETAKLPDPVSSSEKVDENNEVTVYETDTTTEIPQTSTVIRVRRQDPPAQPAPAPPAGGAAGGGAAKPPGNDAGTLKLSFTKQLGLYALITGILFKVTV